MREQPDKILLIFPCIISIAFFSYFPYFPFIISNVIILLLISKSSIGVYHVHCIKSVIEGIIFLFT